jgi:hypothetical protein
VHSLRSTSDLSKSSLYSTTLWPRGGGDFIAIQLMACTEWITFFFTYTIQYNTIQYYYLYSAFPGYSAQSAVLLTYQLI